MAFMYYNSLQQSNKLIYSDKNLTLDEKQKITQKNSTNTLFVMFGIFVITIIGVTLYSNKKEVQYGGGYDIVNFLLY